MASTWLINIGADNVTDEAQYAHRNVAKGSLSVSQSLGGRRAGVMTVNGPDGTYNVEPGREIGITRKGVKLYGGYVWSQDPVIEAGTPLVRNGLTLVDFNVIADWRRAGERTWRDASAEAIVADIVAYDLDAEGITSNFVACATVIKGEYKIVGFPKVSEVLNDLAQRAEAQWYIDEHKNLRFFDADATGYAAPFEVTRDNVTELKISKTLEDYANKVKLNLRQYLMPEAVERFDSEHASYPPDGVRRDFAVPYPIASAPMVTLNGVKVDLGQVGVEADEDKPFFWSPGSQFVSQLNTSTPLAETDVLLVIYIGIGQITVDATNDDQVAARAAIEGGSGFHIKVVSVEDQKSQQQADELAASILAAVDELPVTVNLRTNSELEPACDLLKPGDKLTVLGNQYIVRTIKLQDDPMSADPDLLWLEAEAVRGPMLQDLSGILRDLASGGNTIPVGAPVDDSTALPQTATEGDNMVPDGSFEADVWDSNAEIASRVSRVTGGSAHGVAHLEVTGGADSGGVYSAAFPVSEGLSVAFEGWFQRVGLVTAGLAIEARFYDSAEGELSGALIKPIESGDDADWVSFALVGAALAGAVTARVFAYAGGHSAGVLKVDGLTLRRYSSISAPPAMTSVSASIAQDGAGVVTILASWVQPADLGSATAHQISAAWFPAEDATEPDDVIPLSDPDYRLDVHDGEFVFNGPEVEAWIEIWGANKNGDDVFSGPAKSARYRLTPGIEISNTAGNVQLDTAAPALTWLGDVLTITHRYAPSYPTLTRFSPTLGAYISIEYPDSVTDSVDQPYTANAEADPPDNLQQFDVSITKAQILSVAVDQDGNRTIYIHACGYDDKGRVGYKPFPFQASSATRAIVFSQTDLDGVVALPDPVAPTGLTLTIDNATYPNQFVGRAGWIPGAGDLSGTAQYRLQWGITSANIAPSGWDRDSVAPGANNTVYVTDPWPKDKDQPKFGWFRIRAEMGAKYSAWVTLAVGVLINAAFDTKRPTQPAYGDFLLTKVEYSKDSADAATQVYLQLAVTGTQAGDHTEARIYEGAAPPDPTDIAEFKGVIHSPGSCRFWWPRKAGGMRLQYTAVNCPSPNYRVSPAADNVWKYLDIPAIGNPAAVTGYSVTSSAAYKVAGVLHIDISYTFTPPVDDFMELHLYREQYTDSTFTTRIGPAWNAVPRIAPMVWKMSGKSERVRCSDVNEYWKYVFVPVNWLGVENEAAVVTYNATFTKNTGVDSGALGNLGPGNAIVNGQLMNTATSMLKNPDFEADTDTSWIINGSIVAGAGINSSKGARITASSGGAACAQYVTVQPGTYYRLALQARNSTSGTGTCWVAWYNAAGTYFDWSVGKTISDAAYAQYKFYAKAPVGAARALVYAGYTTASSGVLDVDSVEWGDMPTPGAGQAYDTDGNLVSTALATLTNNDFSFGLSGYSTSDGSWAQLPLDSRFSVVAGGNPGDCLRMQATAAGATQIIKDVPAIPGQVWRVRASVKNETNGTVYVSVAFMDASRNPIATGIAETPVSIAAGLWQSAVNAKTTPSGASFARLKIYTVGTSGYAYLDNLSLELGEQIGGALQRASTDGITRVGDYSVTEALIGDAQVSARAAANGIIARTLQIDTGVIVAAHINYLAALDAYIRNLSVSQITVGGTMSLSATLNIVTGYGHAASIDQWGASFDQEVSAKSFLANGVHGVTSGGALNGTSLNLGPYGISSLGTLVIGGIQMGGQFLTAMAYQNLGPLGYHSFATGDGRTATFYNGILNSIS